MIEYKVLHTQVRMFTSQCFPLKTGSVFPYETPPIFADTSVTTALVMLSTSQQVKLTNPLFPPVRS